MEKQTNTRSVWPYVIVGSAVGGALAYLATTDSGRKMRRSLTHPDELADTVENARTFVERKARIVTEKVHGVINRAKEGMEAGQQAFKEAEANYRSGLQRRVEGKSNEVATNVHRAVDNVNRTAVTFEQSVLEPVYELGAIYKGVERGVRTLLRKNHTQVQPEDQLQNITPMYSDRTGS
jgi:gas vesicle protein